MSDKLIIIIDAVTKEKNGSKRFSEKTTQTFDLKVRNTLLIADNVKLEPFGVI